MNRYTLKINYLNMNVEALIHMNKTYLKFFNFRLMLKFWCSQKSIQTKYKLTYYNKEIEFCHTALVCCRFIGRCSLCHARAT